MAVPLEAHLLERLPASLRRGEPAEECPVPVLPLEIRGASFANVLPDGGIPRGSVVEVQVSGGFSLATTVALSVCRAAQRSARETGGDTPFCAFVDPSATLHGPGVVAAGVDPSRLLVVRPPLAALERTAIRLAESQAFAVVVVDALGVPGASVDVSLGHWPRMVRRLALGVEGSGSTILLLTDGEARRPLPLPVALRLEVSRPAEDRLTVRVGKDRRGRVSGPRSVVWTRPPSRTLTLPVRESMREPAREPEQAEERAG
ncbi:MAG TPA: recombinase A [Polyangiaceae bacterium]|nr:recombinase A [Polyangiaceae bacterium]